MHLKATSAPSIVFDSLLTLNCMLQAPRTAPFDYGKRMLAKTTAFGNVFKVLSTRMAKRFSNNDDDDSRSLKSD
jgi:hypothetical protein